MLCQQGGVLHVAPFKASERMGAISELSSKDAMVQTGPFSPTPCPFRYTASRTFCGYFHNVGASTKQGNTVLAIWRDNKRPLYLKELPNRRRPMQCQERVECCLSAPIEF